MEEPVHHHQQHRDREQAGAGLHVEPGAAERADGADRDEPGCDRREERKRRAAGDRAAKAATRADEARGEGGQDEHRFEPFPEDEQRAVQDDRAVREVGVGGRRVGDAVRRRDRLPGQRADRGERDERPRRAAEAELALGARSSAVGQRSYMRPGHGAGSRSIV